MTTNSLEKLKLSNSLLISNVAVYNNLYSLTNITSNATISLVNNQINIFACNTSTTAITISLPAISSLIGIDGTIDTQKKYIVNICDSTGGALLHNITINPGGFDTINTSSGSVVLNTAYQCCELFIISSTNWYMKPNNIVVG